MGVSCSACADWPRALQKHKQRATQNNLELDDKHPSPPPTQKASPPAEKHSSVDPDAAGMRSATGRDTTKRIPPLLNPFPPDGAPSAASKFLPLPKRHHGLQQTCSAPHHFPGRTDALRHPPRLPLAHALPDDTPRPMVSRVSVISMVPRVSTMLERVLDEMDDRCWPLFFDAQGV